MELTDVPEIKPTRKDNLSCLYFILSIALAVVLYITGCTFLGEEVVQLWTTRIFAVFVLIYIINKALPKVN